MLSWTLLAVSARRDGVGRAPFLHARLGRVPPSRRRHEHARSPSAPARRSCFRLVADRGAGSSSRAAWRPTCTTRRSSSSSRSSCTGNALEARAKRQTAAALRDAGELQPKTGARRCATATRRRSAGRRACGAATSWSCDRASGCRWTASRHRRRERGRRVDAHRRVDAREKRPATASSAGPSIARARSISRDDAGRRQRARADRAADARRAGHRARRSRRWPIASARSSCRRHRRSPSLTFVVWFVACADRRARSSRGVCGGGRRADHRVPVRDGTGRADGGDGGDRPGAELGLLIKGGEALQRAGDVTRWCSTRPAP